MKPAERSETERRLSTETRFPETASQGPALSGLEVPALTILAHPEACRIGDLVALPELHSGQAVDLSRLEPLFAAPGESAAQPLADPQLSRKPLHLAAATDGGVLIERAGSLTPVLLNGEPLDEQRLVAAVHLDQGVVLELGRQVAVLLHRQPPVSRRGPRFNLVGDSGAMMRLRGEIELAAHLDTSVLLRGASGTGKELVARALHNAGPRHDKPWVTVNMAAIPPSLAAAELFGARKGAYTGADGHKTGFFATADGGTLFLDEIGDTPPDVQPLLLRALENGEIQPMGSAATRRVDVRVIAATDANLDDALATGRFRAPLLHRLAGWEIHLPSLAARRSDIGRLLVHFMAGELGTAPQDWRRDGPWASARLVSRLARYGWPGNVRQLSNVARRLAILYQADPSASLDSHLDSLLTAATPQHGETLRPTTPVTVPPVTVPPVTVPPVTVPSTSATSPSPAPAPASPTGRWRPVYRQAAEVGEDELIAALRAHRWDLKPTAEALGISRSVLYQLIEQCPQVRTAAQLEAAEIEAAVVREGGDLAAAAARLEVSAQGLKLRMKALGLR